MSKYKILSNPSYFPGDHKVGDSVEVPDEQVDTLVAVGVLEPKAEAGKPAAKKDSN